MSLNLSITRDRTSQFQLTVTQNGSVLNLTSKTLVFTVKFSPNDDDFIFQKQTDEGIVSSVPASGIAVMTINPSDTTSLGARTIKGLACDLVLLDGSQAYQLDSGLLEVIGNVTELVP